jgi:Fur family zinc uptake transcriptional regulator
MKSEQQKLNKVLTYCHAQGIKLTTLRQLILTILYSHTKPLSAYDILRVLKKQHAKAEAMTVYRILGFLEKNHLVHRIISANTYTACDTPMHEHHAQLLLCDECGYAEEIIAKPLEALLASVLKKHHFKPSSKPIEILGICENCQLAALA